MVRGAHSTSTCSTVLVLVLPIIRVLVPAALVLLVLAFSGFLVGFSVKSTAITKTTKSTKLGVLQHQLVLLLMSTSALLLPLC